MKALLAVAVATLLVSCSKSPDPPFVNQTGDLGAFLVEVTSGGAPPVQISNQLATSWSSRVLTHHHQSGEYLDGRQALQVATAKTNFEFVESVLKEQLGAPSLPLGQEAGLRRIGWSGSDQRPGVWLTEDAEYCRIEIVTETSDGEP